MATPRTFSWQSSIPVSVHDLFEWHTRPGAFSRLNPPWRPVSIITSSDSIREGAQVSIKLPLLGPLGLRWDLTHTKYVAGEEFCDEQVRGPFRSWKHTHSFRAQGPQSSLMIDQIEYQLPRGASMLDCLMTRELRRLFGFRHAVLKADTMLHDRFKTLPRKKVLIAGASGFVGSRLSAFLTTGGHSVIKLVRRPPKSADEREWRPEKGELNPEVFDGVDVVINLSGASIAERRWTQDSKVEIEQSRVRTTALLAQTLAALPTPPAVVIMASATGFYGDTGNSVADENTPRGTGFLATVCERWEAAAKALESSKSRLVTLRIGTVLNAGGGALKKLLPPFLLGVGGTLGRGTQYMSWIALEDLLGIIEHIIYKEELRGAVNAVAPEPCTNKEFTKTLGQALSRPTCMAVPEFVLRAVVGEMAEAALLSSSRVAPKALLESGYSYLLPQLGAALTFECGLSTK